MRGIRLLLLVGLAVCPASVDARTPRAPRSLLPVPPVRQATEYTCGPASLLSVLAYYGKAPMGEMKLAKQARTSTLYGTEERDLLRTARRHGLRASMRYDMTLGELERTVKRGVPVIIGFQAWPDRASRFKPTTNSSGHYAVVIGFDKARVWFMDPAAPLGTRGYLKKSDFLARWHWPDGNGVVRQHFAMTLETGSRTRVPGTVGGVAEIE